MAHDLHHLVRATFNNPASDSRDAAAAFERAVETLIRRRPLLGPEEGRREVATVLGVDADRLAAAEAETGSPSGNDGGGDAAHPGEIPMFASLHRAVRVAYRDALADRCSETEAFDRAVALLMEHDALVGRLEARRRVARMLAQEPVTTTADGGRR